MDATLIDEESFAAQGGVDVAAQRAHYYALDFLRGVAAAVVVWKHFASRLDLPELAPHGYLAVDFFFVLSGFVVASAYGPKLEVRRLSVKEFYIGRAIRLLPMIALGTVVAAIVEIGRPAVASQGQHLADTLLALVFGVFVIPLLARTATLEATVFPLNTPAWSLFLELWANAIFAVWARRRLSLWAVGVTMALSLALLSVAAASYGHLNVGFQPSAFWLGFPRVAWSFGAGMVIYKFRNHAPRVSFFVAPITLTVFLLLPITDAFCGVYDAFGVIVLMPALVFSSLKVDVSGWLARVSTWSGNLSYPMYALHYPIVRVVSVAARRVELSVAARLSFVAVLTVFILAFSALVYSKCDEPLRAWLTRLRRQSQSR